MRPACATATWRARAAWLAALWIAAATLRCGGGDAAPGKADAATEVAPADGVTAPADPTATDLRQVVPGPGLPAEVSPQNSNNNLDVVAFDGKVFLTGRTAPNHFAGPDARLWVASSSDEKAWQFETQAAMATDLREPRLLAFAGKLRWYFAQLGSDPAQFQPKGAWVAERTGPGQWTKPQPFYLPTFIPWRLGVHAGKAWLCGYTDGDNVYKSDPGPISVHLVRSTDGQNWTPALGNDPVVLKGGVSETAFAVLDDGTVVAVGRNEAGEVGYGFGSKVCKAAPGQGLQCKADPKKYDSPLLFVHAGQVWLIGRRTLNPDGSTANYDLGAKTGTLSDHYTQYQLANWTKRKRCALWKVDPAALSVAWQLDLPSRGDTCFASLVPAGPDRYAVYNYSSPLDGSADPLWFEGQMAETRIYRSLLVFGKP